MLCLRLFEHTLIVPNTLTHAEVPADSPGMTAESLLERRSSDADLLETLELLLEPLASGSLVL